MTILAETKAITVSWRRGITGAGLRQAAGAAGIMLITGKTCGSKPSWKLTGLVQPGGRLLIPTG